MRDYGKVHSSFWSSPTISALTDDGKMLALYLMTCQHNTIAGVFRIPDGYAREDLGWDAVRVVDGFVELFDKGFATRCIDTKWVWIRKHLVWNPPENPNQRKAIAKIAAQVPDECAWKLDFMRVCGELSGNPTPPETTQNSNGCGTVAEPFLNQEQEQEQEQESRERKPAKKGARLAEPSLPDEWATFCRAERPDLNPAKTFDRFRDYWQAQPGAKGVKLDWLATWRNWVRNERAEANGKPSPASQALRGYV